MNKKNSCDFMAIGAHPDDVEIFCGGTVLTLMAQGKQGVIVDLTDGSAGTRGNINIRSQEAIKSSKVLGVSTRENLGLMDTAVANERSSQLALIQLIRKFRPKVLITHWHQDEHPDHRHTYDLVKDACYMSGLTKIECGGKAHRPSRIFYFLGSGHAEPTFCVDISDQWKKKMKAIACYQSQFFGKNSASFRGKTALATPEFLQSLEVKAKYYGGRIKRAFAEPFICEELPEIQDLTSLGEKKF